MTVGQALATARLRMRGSASARLDAARMLEATLGRDAAWLLANDAAALDTEAIRRYENAVGRRLGGEPVAYIVGQAGFYGRLFEITPDVLVPRPETEQLAERAIAFLRSWSDPCLAVCDVGTGSGVLAITLSCELPSARGVATDASPGALAVAKRNAVANGVAGRLEFVVADLLDDPAVAGFAPFACIVANLPYVPTAELAPPPDPMSFEPRLALDGGPDGLAVYRRLLAAAPPLLSRRAAVFMEAAPGTAAPLAGLATKAFGRHAEVTIDNDYGGRERVVTVRLA